MKFFAVILAFLVLALSLLPCTDIHSKPESQKTEISKNSADEHENDTDLCSPFCNCNCCQHFVFNHDNYIEFTCYEFSQKNYLVFTSFAFSATFNSIWQPPKMS